ncbi:MAG: DUF4925 domain-containing protein [Tannerellaceae bacterium]|jgi:hypothetical protein|nr:DUF4925 domain-containing protein [Tannerellaceae bacterium]
MKKNFLMYLLMTAFTVAFFAACGGDDDKPKPGPGPTPGGGGKTPTETTWKDGVGTYDGNTLVIDGKAAATSQKSAAIAIGSGDDAKITLTNVLPDTASVEFDGVKMTKSESNYTFESETTVGATTISIKGTLSGIPATKADETKEFSINVTRKINSPIVGTWKLNFSEKGGDVFVDVKTGDAAVDKQYALLGAMLGGKMAEKVSAVTSILTDNGAFDVNWVKQGEKDPTGMPPAIQSMVSIQYFVSENQLFVALDKSLLPLLGVFLGDNFNMDSLLALMVDKGGYYALPVSMKVEGDSASFYMSKEMLGAVLVIATPILGNKLGDMDPVMAAMLKAMLEQLPELIKKSEKFDVGLNFSK